MVFAITDVRRNYYLDGCPLLQLLCSTPEKTQSLILCNVSLSLIVCISWSNDKQTIVIPLYGHITSYYMTVYYSIMCVYKNSCIVNALYECL